MLQQFPNMLAWINGHTYTQHDPTPPDGKGGGFWEITAASCVDFPQQQQLIELLTTATGHCRSLSPLITCQTRRWKQNDFSQAGLASLSRNCRSNDWIANPPMRAGSPLDRNTELLMRAPFDVCNHRRRPPTTTGQKRKHACSHLRRGNRNEETNSPGGTVRMRRGCHGAHRVPRSTHQAGVRESRSTHSRSRSATSSSIKVCRFSSRRSAQRTQRTTRSSARERPPRTSRSL